MSKVWSAIKTYFRTTDRWLLLFWLGASGVSMLYLYGVYRAGYLGSSTLYMQAFAIGLGLFGAIVASLFDYRILLKLWRFYLPLCVILVLLTFVTGTVRGDNQAWLAITVGGRNLSLQPSEILKISFITTFALHLEKVKDRLNAPVNLLLLCLHGGAHIALIQLQGDTGSALIFFCIFVVMLFSAGLKWRYIMAAGAAAVAAVPLFWFVLLTEDQKMRFHILFNPGVDTVYANYADYAFQQLQGTVALVMGGVRGTGIFAEKHQYVPEMYNDFIFTFIGESSGFIGCLGVMVLLVAICLKLLYNSSVATDDTGRHLCIGVFAMFLSQATINLGMCLSVFPVIGVNLPLISSGGTSVLALYMGLGLVLSVYGHANTSLFSQH